MLAYYLNNVPFLLDQGTSVRLTWLNPACFFDAIPGDVGIGITIAVNDTNRALLGNPERFEKYASGSSREFENFEIRFSGKLLMSGTLVVQIASSETYSAWLRSNVGNLGKLHREKFIYDISAFNEAISFTNKANYVPTVDPYGCPRIYNPDFFKDKGGKIELDREISNPDWYLGSDKEQFISDPYKTEIFSEAFRITANWNVNDLNEDSTVKTPTTTSTSTNVDTDLGVNVVSPMLFLNYVIETVLKDASFFINDNFIANNIHLRRLILYNNYDITEMSFTAVDDFLTINWFDGEVIQIAGGKVDGIQRDYTGTFKYKDLLPKVSLAKFLLSVQNSLNVCFHFLPDQKVNIIDRETILTNPTIDLTEHMVSTWGIDEKKDVTLKFIFKHDNDDTFFQDRWEDIDDIRENEGEAINDWNSLSAIVFPEIGEVRYIIETNEYVKYEWIQKVEIDPNNGDEITTDILGWRSLTIGFQNGFHNRGKDVEENIETEFSSLFRFGGHAAITHQKGNIKSLKYAYQNFTPRLLFYISNNNAKYETTGMSLDWEKEETGLMATRWPVWSKFWSQRQPVHRDSNLPLNMLDYTIRNITSKFRSYEGEFIIEKMETEFSLNAIGTTKITGYKV